MELRTDMSTKPKLSDRLPEVIYVSPFGVARLDWPWNGGGRARLAEADARTRARADAAGLPGRVSPHIAAAPARGPCIAEVPRETVMTASGPRDRRASPVGFDRLRVGDAFDVMEEQARRGWPRVVEAARKAHPDVVAKARARHQALDAARVSRGEKPVRFRPPKFVEPAFEPPFTPGQVAAARDYAALTERVASSGVKCSSVETVGGGGGGLSEAVARDMMRLAALHRRIGDGLAKDAVRPSKGGMRSAIRVRALVDQVCLGGATISQVLAAHGWGANKRMRALLREALGAALDRMRGYDLVRPQNLP
ncbi:hypothetical protein [Mameliella alba]|nr:hypothetical protein [Mameliella alba]